VFRCTCAYSLCVALAERTYSFRAPIEFGERLARTRKDFVAIARDPTLSVDFGRELPLTLLRRFEKLDQDVPDGVLARTLLDAFMSATERVRSERARMTELAAVDRA